MRLSADKDDPGYPADPEDIFRYNIYVDGQRILNCLTADEEEGFALVFVRDPKRPGAYKKDPIRVRGFVRLERLSE